MAIKTVKATINGQTYDLTLNSASGKWEATITAPGKTSYNLAGGYYNVSVEATNEAGTKGSADASTVDGLKLVVKETVAPVITIVSPTAGAYVANSKQPVVFNITDETGGSGVDISTLVVKQDGTASRQKTRQGRKAPSPGQSRWTRLCRRSKRRPLRLTRSIPVRRWSLVLPLSER